ncbi:hypothetical protein RCZ04_01660 [Capnocytophaga sp. HP1101]
MIRTDKIAEANTLLKKFLWLDLFIVSFDEREIILFGTMDSSFGKQVEIILIDVCYIDMPTVWKLDLTSENPILFTAQNEMNEISINRFLDNNNGKGNLFTFTAEGFNNETKYHIVADSFELHLLSYDSYFTWETNM